MCLHLSSSLSEYLRTSVLQSFQRQSNLMQILDLKIILQHRFVAAFMLIITNTNNSLSAELLIDLGGRKENSKF